MPFYISPPPRNPLTGIVTGIVAVLIMTGVFMLGFFALVIALVVGSVVALGIYIRIWWAKRQMIKQGIDPASLDPFSGHRPPAKDDSLEAEYEVISKTQDD